MGDRSTLEFKSNIYPLSNEGQIINDRPFLDHISDPFALDLLWRYNGTRGSKLNRLQKRQFEKGQHCTYAETGDFPWGTRLVDGKPRVVCLCENWSCPLIHECRPGIEIPETGRRNYSNDFPAKIQLKENQEPLVSEDVLIEKGHEGATSHAKTHELEISAGQESEAPATVENVARSAATLKAEQRELKLPNEVEPKAQSTEDQESLASVDRRSKVKESWSEPVSESPTLNAADSNLLTEANHETQIEVGWEQLASEDELSENVREQQELQAESVSEGEQSKAERSEHELSAEVTLETLATVEREQGVLAGIEADVKESGEAKISDVLEAGRLDYFEKHYDENQAVIVEADPTVRLYVTAGPGTGKTYTLIEKLKYMIDVQEVDPGSIMVMSFTRSAVQVIKDRLQHAALDNQITNNWQAIDVVTFDKFCTRLLYWLKTNRPEMLGRLEIGSMDYDHRINAAAMYLRKCPELISQCQHLVVDETQDLVGPRARLVLSMVGSLPESCGITLLGDRCQSVYDYQATSPTNDSEAFYDGIQEMGGFTSITLERNYRQNVQLPYSLDALRHCILERDASSAGAQVSEVLASLGEPECDLRSLDLSSLGEKQDGTLGILTRTNAQAIAISSLFYKHGIPHTLLRMEREAYWSRIVADVLIDYGHETIDEDYFVQKAGEKGISFEESIRAWIGLTSLRDARAEGTRYKVENLLQAMTEEIVPESLAATKGVEPGITISTIHGSKGREYDRVWLMSQDLEAASKSSMLDEQKVAYVALSRARMGISLQKSEDGGLKIDGEGSRCYRVSVPKKRAANRPVRKRLTHIELHNSTDIDQTTLLSVPELKSLVESGALEGVEIRLCLPEKVPESGLVAYEIKTDDGILLGKMTKSFTSYYEKYYERAVGDQRRFLPEAFDEVYVDRIISCVGKSASAPETARKFGNYAIWYGFTLGGFAHVDDSQSH